MVHFSVVVSAARFDPGGGVDASSEPQRTKRTGRMVL